MAAVKIWVSEESLNLQAERDLWFNCPGCKLLDPRRGHGLVRLVIPRWTWDGNLERPTISPSILTHYGRDVCHSFIREGRIEFLIDSTHSLAGTTVDLPELPDWFAQSRTLEEPDGEEEIPF